MQAMDAAVIRGWRSQICEALTLRRAFLTIEGMSEGQRLERLWAVLVRSGRDAATAARVCGRVKP